MGAQAAPLASLARLGGHRRSGPAVWRDDLRRDPLRRLRLVVPVGDRPVVLLPRRGRATDGMALEAVPKSPEASASGHEADDRGGQAMMRLRRASAIVGLFLFTSAATADAECAWVLWQQQ